METMETTIDLIKKYRQHRRFRHNVTDDSVFIDCGACAVWERQIARLKKKLEGERQCPTNL